MRSIYLLSWDYPLFLHPAASLAVSAEEKLFLAPPKLTAHLHEVLQSKNRLNNSVHPGGYVCSSCLWRVPETGRWTLEKRPTLSSRRVISGVLKEAEMLPAHVPAGRTGSRETWIWRLHDAPSPSIALSKSWGLSHSLSQNHFGSKRLTLPHFCLTIAAYCLFAFRYLGGEIGEEKEDCLRPSCKASRMVSPLLLLNFRISIQLLYLESASNSSVRNLIVAFPMWNVVDQMAYRMHGKCA